MEDGPVTRFAKDVGAGTVAGIAVCLVGHPFDTLKVRLQTQPTVNPIYSGPWDCFKKTMQWEGVGGLYKGVASPLVGQMFFRAVLFSSYGQSQVVLRRSVRDGAPLKRSDYFVAGAMTGAAASFIEGPIDMFKSQIQVQILSQKTASVGASTATQQYKNVFDCARVIASEHGIRGIYQGLSAVLLRNIPANAIYFGMNQETRRLLATEQQPIDQLSPGKLLFAGGVAGFLYWFVTFPADVIKSSMQSDNPNQLHRKYHGTIDCTRQLYQQAGIARFYKGFTPCLLRSVPANAVMWLVFEKARSYL